jgi:hypothetical protein
MKMSAKFSLLIGSGLLAAGVVWAQSTVIVYERRAPGRAAMIGIPPQGWTKASLSHALQGARLVKNPESAPGSLERQLAQEAFAAEPLATPALSVLIQSLAADGKQRKSERLIELAAELSRRDNLVNAMQIDEALKRKQTQRAMGLLGRAMSVDYEVRYMYLERMAAGTASAGASDVLVPMLGRNPKWSLDYWNAVLRVPNALVRAGEIRRRIAGTPWNVNNPSKTDFELIAELAKRGHPALARDIASSLGMSVTSSGELLAGSMFNHQPRFVPFEWELLQTGDVGATIDSKAGTLAISSLPGASGVVARQLIEISAPGVYRLRWSLAGLAANPDALLKFRLTCAEPTRAGPPIPPITIGEGNGSAVLTIPTSSCAWYGATLEFGAQSSSVGTDIAIERLSLRRE